MSTVSKIKYAHQDAQCNAHLVAIRSELARHPEVKQALAIFPPALRNAVSLRVSDYTDSIYIGVSISELDSFKSKRLSKPLERFDDTWQANTMDYTYSAPNRDYEFTKKIAWTPKPSKHTQWVIKHGWQHRMPDVFTLHLRISAYVKSDSPTCRVVIKEVRERVVCEEIKEIMCD